MDNRIKARRTTREVQTKYGTIKFKVAQVGDSAINVSPEYEDCKRAALERKVPLKEVMEEVRAAALGIDFTGQS